MERDVATLDPEVVEVAHPRLRAQLPDAGGGLL
jgi:hypothetical protein